MESYDAKAIEEKWQRIWEEEKIFEAEDFSKKPKFFVLDMFPYPSGAGLHVGHPRGYIGTDIISNYMRMKGYNVLHPMGWDAFGLPAENYAIQTGIHPAISTEKNIKRFKEQMKTIGLSYDWSREINTTDPDYYKWTQWIFLKLFERGLAYQATLPINWCPSCKTGLANEEVVGGVCERCGSTVTKRNIKQWVLKITDYAEKLLNGLEKLDWPEKIKEMQRNWIGRSEGAEIEFSILNSQFSIKVFTTRPDTIFGATFMVLAPEHELVAKITTPDKLEEVKKYQEQTKKKLDIERQVEDKEKTGLFIGVYAVNPATEEKIPVYIADYVLPHYGHGAIMGVPAHDERDYDFAKKFDLPIKQIELDKTAEQATKWLEKKGCGKKAVNYKLRDWVFSRQRYWGEPIPLVFCPVCKKKIESKNYKKGEFNEGELLNPGWVALSESELPLTLPKIEKYQPTGTGESPLAQAKDWVETTCPRCGGKAVRETNTMPQWAGSCWYFIRYLDSKNKKELAGKKLMKYWLPVDFYIGGAEHAVLHLLYSRFWLKVLHDAKIIHFDEPFLKLQTIGLILAPDGRKMSKSRGNVINPDEIIEQYGADTFRLYEMFMGPFDQPISWDPKGILGANRFLEKIWKLIRNTKLTPTPSPPPPPRGRGRQPPPLSSPLGGGGKEGEGLGLERKLHQTIKKVTEDIDAQKFNTAIAAMMEFVNEAQNLGIAKKQAEDFLKILAPFAPHISEELWQSLGHKESILKEKWPEYDKKLIKEEAFYLVVQINGKLRDTIGAPLGISEKQAKELALKSEKIQKWLENRKIKKTIFLKDKLINFVLK